MLCGCTDRRTICAVFFFNDTATTEIYTLSLHDALPISADAAGLLGGDDQPGRALHFPQPVHRRHSPARQGRARPALQDRSEEHTSELQSLAYLVCRLLLEKKNTRYSVDTSTPTHPPTRT